MTHVLFSPLHSDFVRGVDGRPVTTELVSPTRADAAAAVAAHHAALPADLRAKAPAPEVPAGTHFMALEDSIDGTGEAGSELSPSNKLSGESTIALRGPVAVRLFKLFRK
jgi:hypothetical protein